MYCDAVFYERSDHGIQLPLEIWYYIATEFNIDEDTHKTLLVLFPGFETSFLAQGSRTFNLYLVKADVARGVRRGAGSFEFNFTTTVTFKDDDVKCIPNRILYYSFNPLGRMTITNNADDQVLVKKRNKVMLVYDPNQQIYKHNVCKVYVPIERNTFATHFRNYTGKSIEWHNFYIHVAFERGLDNTHLLITYKLKFSTRRG